jgi:16S rRNA (guanine(1405)-N(7))-methyltransferase
VEAGKGRSYKETVKAVKNKLHQVGGAYFNGEINYPNALNELRAAAESPEAYQAACKRIMAGHASTKERLPIMDSFYSQILSEMPQPASILDIACGLNPLAFPWIGLPKSTRYQAYDIYADMVAFLNDSFKISGINGQASVSNVIEFPPEDRADLALVLKAIPCLEQVDKSAGKRILGSLQAKKLVVSFPGKSLGGRSKGMVENYEAHFLELLGSNQHIERRIEFPNELVFVVQNP